MSELEKEQIIDGESTSNIIANSLIFQHSKDPIILINWDFSEMNNILRINEKATQLLGYSEDEIKNVPFGNLFFNSEFCQNVSQFLRINPETLFLHTNMRTKLGNALPVEIIFEMCENHIFALIREKIEDQSSVEMKSYKSLLFDTLTQPLLLIDKIGTILECNATAAEKIDNTSKKELIGKNLFDLLPPKISEARRNKVQRVIESKETVDFIDERNGITYNNHYFPIMEENGDIGKIAILADDISILNKLQKNLLLTQFSVDKSGISIIWFDDNGKITYANDLACQKIGYSNSELLQLNILDIYPMKTQARLNEISQNIKKTGTYKNEIIVLRKNGSSFPAFTSVNHLEIEGISHYFAYFFDNSEKRDFQWELNKLYYAIEQSPISISMTDPNAIIEYVNPKYCELSGYTYEECIGKKEGFLKSGEKSNSEYEQMWQTLKDRKLWQGVFHNKNKNGQSYWEKVTISNIIDSNGNIKNYLALKEDITENKILQEKLYQSRKMEALGRLAGGVAHDFNNLLTIIMGYSQVLESFDDNPYLNEITEIIKTTEKAAALTAQLLAFSKRQIMQPKLMDINITIQQMYSMLTRTFPSSISLQFDLSNNPLPVIIDKTQFEQVILNLIFNAKEAVLPKGKGTIRLSTQMINSNYESSENKLYAQVSIQDDGIGMDEATKKSLFEPFFTTKLKGTGLGLSTVYGIVSQSNGFVEIESEIGKGTAFNAHFPIQFEQIEPPRMNSNEMNSLSGKETILLIEDNKGVRKILSLLLKKSGYSIIEARNGVDGFRLFETNRNEIDLIISDLVMPEMGGVEVLEKIRKICPDVRCIFISGYAGEQQGILGKDEIIIAKPIDRMKFLETIRSVICSVPNSSLYESSEIKS